MQSIRSLIPITLVKYFFQVHVLEDTAVPASLDWTSMDCVVMSWLYDTISSDLHNLVMSNTTQGHPYSLQQVGCQDIVLMEPRNACPSR